VEQQKEISNEISDETGQFDARFILWRKFCADHRIPVESLPSTLTGDVKKAWENLKEVKLGVTGS
jgi:hypothetical protein